MLDKQTVKVLVQGDYACFSMPWSGAHRYSYDCLTPSAARGILSSILWKPEIQWVIRSIRILKPIKRMTYKFNGVNCVKNQPINVNDPKNRCQRAYSILKNPAYIIEASVYVSEDNIKKIQDRDRERGRKPCEPVVKYRDMFNKRLKRGRCKEQPCLGLRKFPCFFSPVTEEDERMADELNLNLNINNLLFGMLYDEKGIPTPIYMTNANIRNSTLICPDDLNRIMMTSCNICPTHSKEVRARLDELNNNDE